MTYKRILIRHIYTSDLPDDNGCTRKGVFQITALAQAKP